MTSESRRSKQTYIDGDFIGGSGFNERCCSVRKRGVTNSDEYTVSAVMMRSNGGVRWGTCDMVETTEGALPAITVSLSQFQSAGGMFQSSARTWIDPLSDGRLAMLSAMFWDSTESMTTGRSVARTSQPRAHNASLEGWKHHV